MENILLDSIAEKLTLMEEKVAKTEVLVVKTNDSMKEVKEILNFLRMDHKSMRTAIEYNPPARPISDPTPTYALPHVERDKDWAEGIVPGIICLITLVLAASLFSAGLGRFGAFTEELNQIRPEVQKPELQTVQVDTSSGKQVRKQLSPSRAKNK